MTDRIRFWESPDGGPPLDADRVRGVISVMVFDYVTEHPERRRDVETRPPGLNWREVGDGVVEVLFPPTDERPELVIGTVPLSAFSAGS